MFSKGIFLTSDGSIWVDDAHLIIENKQTLERHEIPDTNPGKVFKRLLSKANEKVNTTEIANMLECEILDDKTSTSAVKNNIDRMKALFRLWKIPYSEEFADIGLCLVIKNTPSERKMKNGGYTLYLPFVDRRNDIVKRYWSRYLKVSLSKSNDSFGELHENMTLNEIYVLPNITSEELTIGNSSPTDWNLSAANTLGHLIQAPNGFGKSTLMKSILLSSTEDAMEGLSEATKLQFQKIRLFHGIDLGSFPIFIELKAVNNFPDEDIDGVRWLYDALSEDDSISIDVICDFNVFAQTLKYHNTNNKLILLLDGYDEIEASDQKKLNGIIKQLQTSEYGNNSKVIISTRPFLQFSMMNAYKRWRIESLNLEKDATRIQEIISNYSKFHLNPQINKALSIFNNLCENYYLKMMITNPTILIRVVIGYLYGYEPHQIVEKSIVEMMLRYKYKSTREKERHYKMVFEEIAYIMFQNKAIENRLVCNVYEFERMIDEIIDKLERYDTRFKLAFEELDHKALGNLFYTKVALLEAYNGSIGFSVPLLFSLHFVARKLLRVMLKDGIEEEKILQLLDYIEQKYRFEVIVIAATIVHHLETTYKSDFSGYDPDVPYVFSEWFYQYLMNQYQEVKDDENKLLYWIQAVQHLLKSVYGTNTFTRHYNEPTVKVKFDRYLTNLNELCS